MKNRNSIVSTSSVNRGKKKRVRKIMAEWTFAQTEKLIGAVRSREGLWNVDCSEYKERKVRDVLWKEVSHELGLARSEVAAKWNSLRSSFRVVFNKTLANREEGRQIEINELHKALMFLEPTLIVKELPAAKKISKIELITSNSSDHHRQMIEEAEESDLDIGQLLPSPKAQISKRRRMETRSEDEDETQSYGQQFVETTMREPQRHDIWDDIGHFIAANGREWSSVNPRLASKFRTALYKVVADCQVKLEETDYGT